MAVVMALSRVLLVLATVVMTSYAYYASTPPDVALDLGSVLVVLTMNAAWLAPYGWWNHCFVQHERGRAECNEQHERTDR